MIAATGASQFNCWTRSPAFRALTGNESRCFISTNTSVAGDHPASFRNDLRARLIDVGIDITISSTEQDPAAVILHGRTRPAERSDRCRAGWDRRERPPRVQRSPADFDTRGALPRGDAGRPAGGSSGEGWFENLSDVPRQAISMGIRQILSAQEIIARRPGRAKGKGGGGCCGRGHRSAGARLDSSHPSQHHDLSGQEVRCNAQRSGADRRPALMATRPRTKHRGFDVRV